MNNLFKLILPLMSLTLTSCGNTLPNNISQNDWNAHRQYVTLSTGVKMSYVEMGNSSGQPIILQHGMTDNSRSWSLAAPYFANAGYHVYMPDLRGQGYSTEMSGDYTTLLYARDLNAFFEAKNIDKAICVGHSLGSFTMQSFWMLYPERIEKCVLVSTGPLYDYLTAALLPIREMVKSLPEGGHMPDAFMDLWYDCSSEPVEEEIKGETFDTFISYMKTEAQALSKNAWLSVINGILDTNINGCVEGCNLYSQFDKSKKCLILHGSTDTMAKSSFQQEIIDLLSNADKSNVTYREYEGVGHNIQFVTPKKCSTDIIGWLNNGVLPD